MSYLAIQRKKERKKHSFRAWQITSARSYLHCKSVIFQFTENWFNTFRSFVSITDFVHFHFSNFTKNDVLQEFCLDLYQPSGMGRRRKRSEPVGQVEYFYPSRNIQSAPLRIKKNETFVPASADINDNIGVTVIMPEGKQPFL